LNISVLICTRNPDRAILRRVLQSLPRSLPSGELDLVLIDNASNPPLTVEEFADAGPPCRIVCEPAVGSVHARRTALRTARGELIVFVDDDNVLASDYLMVATDFMRRHPEVGAASGKIIGEFATPPPAWMRPHLGLLALRDLGDRESISDWSGGQGREFPYTAPYGAGMILRKACADAYFSATQDFSALLVGRRGTRFLGGCEDAEIVLFGVLKAGWQTGYCPALSLTHVIPARRLTAAYLNQLAFQTGISWGEFCVRHGFESALPRWTVLLRWMRRYVRDKAWTRSGKLTWKTYAGRCLGRSRKQPPASA
jgi:glycosyltransferase involved in cell wall biosynthesis